MSASKSCPACLKQWAGTFKFCPEDGALLIPLNAADTVLQTPAITPEVAEAVRMKAFNASDTVVVAAVRPSDTDEYASPSGPPKDNWRSPTAANGVERAPPVVQRSPGPKSRKGAPRILNLEPIEAHTATLDAVPASGRRELELRVAPTVMTAATGEALMAESRSRAPQPVREPMPSPPRVVAGRGLKRVDGASSPGKDPKPAVSPPAAVAGRPAVSPPAAVAGKPAVSPPAAVAGRPAVSPPAAVAGRPAAAISASKAGRAPAEVAPKRAQLDARTRASEPAATARSPTAPQGKAIKSAGPAAAGKSLRKDNAFSETAWFMAAPELPVDDETGRVEVDPKAYVRDESIPEEKRRRFSLRRKDEE